MKYLFILLFLVGCGQYRITDHGIYQNPKPFKPTGTIDAEMQSLLDEYHHEAAKRNVRANYSKLLEVNWSDELGEGDQRFWGFCNTYINPNKKIVGSIILSRHMDTDIPACQRKLLIFHEFSHCLLGVQHTSRDPENVLHIMYWSSGWEQSYNCDPETGEYKNWSYYLDFLFLRQDLEQVD
jgi:hypothetical protein